MDLNKVLFKFIKIAFGILVVLLIVYAAINLSGLGFDFGYRVFTESAIDNPPGKDVLVQVKDDTSEKELGVILEEKGLVIYTLHTARHDREKACDNDVLQSLGQNYAAKYGQTILRAAASRFSSSSSLSFKSKSRKKLLKTRLQLIVDFKSVTNKEKRKCIYAFSIIILLMTVCAPLSVYALDDTQYKDFAPVNLESLDLSSYFSDYT